MAKLTEKDILAWDGPEEDYMNAQHLEFFRNLLSQQQDEIINKADATTDRMQHDTASAADPADRASQEEEYALELRARDRERKLLAKNPSRAARNRRRRIRLLPRHRRTHRLKTPARPPHGNPIR